MLPPGVDVATSVIGSEKAEEQIKNNLNLLYQQHTDFHEFIYQQIKTLGGINVGLPQPTVPGAVTATTYVTAPAIIGSVITYGAILMDPEGGAPYIRSMYDLHQHQAPLGQTSPPLPPYQLIP